MTLPIPLVNTVEMRQMVEILDSIAPRLVVDRALRAADLNRDILRADPGFLPYVSEAIVLESVARSLGEHNLGALVGQRFDYQGFDAIAQYVLAAPTLSDALVRSRRAFPLVHPGSDFTLRQVGDKLVFGYQSGLDGVVGNTHLSQGAIFLITYVFRHFLGADWAPAWVEVPHSGKTDRHRLQDLTGADVLNSTDIAAIAIQFDDLLASNPVTPPPEEIVTLSDLPALMGVSLPQSQADLVKEVMRTQLILGDLSEDSVARRLSMGRRTLQRSLMAEGVSFRDLRNGLIQARACALLSDSTIAFDKIAQTLGYSEPNSFRRAFRSWTGVSPSQFRQARGRLGA